MLLDALPPPPAPPAQAAGVAARVDAVVARPVPHALEALLAVLPPTSDPALGGRRARVLYLLGRHDEAAAAYWRILQVHRSSVSALFGLAWTYQDEGEFGMAHGPLAAGLALAPNFEPGWRELGLANYNMKRFGQAITASGRAIALDPTDAAAWRTSGLALGLSGQFRAGIKALTRASALSPRDEVSRRMRGRFCLVVGQPAEAEVALRAALALDPTDTEAQQLLVKALFEQGHYLEAIRRWWGGR